MRADLGGGMCGWKKAEMVKKGGSGTRGVRLLIQTASPGPSVTRMVFVV